MLHDNQNNTMQYHPAVSEEYANKLEGTYVLKFRILTGVHLPDGRPLYAAPCGIRMDDQWHGLPIHFYEAT